MIEGLFALAGVLLGGVLTVGVELFLAARRAREQRRLAARVLLDEFTVAASLVAVAEANSSLSALDAIPSIGETWRDHREYLAHLELTTWAVIRRAVMHAELVPHTGRDWQGPSTDQMLEDMRTRFDAAAELLLADLQRR
jgi:hypothetical protein